MNWSKIALIVVLLLCAVNVAISRPRLIYDDFKVYYTAATLVREHKSLEIYNGADTGVDPQLQHADPHSLFAQEAQKLGIPVIRMYVYPPVVADLLVPFTAFPVSIAASLWTAFSILVVLVSAWLMVQMTQMQRLGPWALGALAVGVLTFLPLQDCLVWGQVSILLLGLWTLGVFCYTRNWIIASALVFALATTMKLTPLLVIVPFLLWKEWRWLGAYVAGLAGIVLGILAINGSACLTDCFRHVIPSMSNGNPYSGNKSLMASFQLVYEAFHGIDVRKLNLNSAVVAIPHGVVILGKASGFLCLLAAVILIWQQRARAGQHTRMVTLAVLPLLATLVSPVSWKHAYAMALLTYVVLWTEVFRARLPNAYIALLALCSVELNWFVVSYAFRYLLHGPALGFVFVASILCGLILVLYRLGATQHFIASERSTDRKTDATPIYS